MVSAYLFEIAYNAVYERQARDDVGAAVSGRRARCALPNRLPVGPQRPPPRTAHRRQIPRLSARRGSKSAPIANARSTPAAPSPARLQRQSERLHQALLDGDESEVRKIARRLVDEGTTIVDLVEQVISPPLRAIGQAWHDGNLTIWVEHRASAIVERALGDLLPNPRGRRRGTVMVAAVSGDLHSLPTTMASSCAPRGQLARASSRRRHARRRTGRLLCGPRRH